MEAKNLSNIFINDRGDFCFFSPERGRRYLMARGNTIINEIFYDSEAEAPPLPFIFLIPWFQRIHKFKFTFKSLMSEDEAKKRNLKALVTFEQNLKGADESDDNITVQKMVMVTRTIEDQYYLLDREVHPFEITILSSDGSEVKFVFMFTLKIDDGMKVVSDFPGGNAMGFVERLIISKLNAKLRKLKFDELRGTTNDGILNELNEIISELNAGEFQPHGFSLLHITHEATIIPKATQERINAEQKVPIAESEKQASIKKAEGDAEVKKITANATAEATRTTEAAVIEMAAKKVEDVGVKQTALLKNNLKVVYEFNKDDRGIVDQTKTKIAYNLGQTKGVVVIGNETLSGGTARLVENIVANQIQTQEEGGSHAS